jgi:phage terminase small subunit
MEIAPRMQLFVDEYLVDLNATQAAIRAGYSKKTANEQGARLLANVSVMELIQKRMQERSERTEITQDMVLKHWWKIATADPRKLIEYRRCACRHCYGKDHKWQWIDEAEFSKAYAEAVKAQEENPNEVHLIPENKGGYGFNPTHTPHAECPHCFGRGHGEVAPHDTRNLDEQSALLYAGVKVTKEGLEIKMRDQDGALENVAKHLGMFIDRKEVGQPGDFERLTDEEIDERIRNNAAKLAAQDAIRTASTPRGKAKAPKPAKA